MKPVLGIDFGTTNTAAAWVDRKGDVQVVPVREDSSVLPSVVCFHRNGSVLVGHSARELVVDDPKNTIFGVKRFLGRMYMSDFVGRHRGRFLFHLVEGPEGLAAVEVFGETRPFEDVAHEILKRIVELANIAAGQPFEECVLAVPAHYTYRQRQVIRRTAERLLKVKAMVNEPTAASLYYARDQAATVDGTILVYDLGGGTFDATLLRVRRGLVEVLATGGDAFLGGADFDAKVVEHLCEQFERSHDVDLRKDMVVMQRLAFASEKAKIALSSETEAGLRVPCITVKGDRFLDLEVTLTRAELEALCAPLIERTLGISEKIIERAGLSPHEIDSVVFVGGQTHMPSLRQRLLQRLPFQPGARVDPELAVAIGAALLGRGIHVLVDVVSVPVGVMLPGVGPREAVPRNMALPCVRRVPIPQRPAPGQPLGMVVYEALDVTSIDRDVLGTARVEADWLAAHPGDLALEVRMSASFELSLFLHAGEARLPLEVRATGKSAVHVGTLIEAAPTHLVRTAPRIELDQRVSLASPTGAPYGWYPAENLSSGGVFVATARPLSLGTRVIAELDTDAGTLRIEAEVVRIVDEERARGLGQSPGMGLRFLDLTADLRSALELHVARRTGKELPADEPLLLTDALPEGDGPDAGARTSRTVRLKAFLASIASNDVYAALELEPLAPVDEVRFKLESFRALLEEKSATADPALQNRLGTASQILERTASLLLDPRRRLHYDFKAGHVLAEERIALAATTGSDVEMLREAWRRVHPDDVEKAAIHQAYAVRASRLGDFAAAVDAGEKALSLDPFDLDLRRAVESWRLQALAERT